MYSTCKNYPHHFNEGGGEGITVSCIKVLLIGTLPKHLGNQQNKNKYCLQLKYAFHYLNIYWAYRIGLPLFKFIAGVTGRSSFAKGTELSTCKVNSIFKGDENNGAKSDTNSIVPYVAFTITTEGVFRDVIGTKSFAPCYSQSPPPADFTYFSWT